MATLLLQTAGAALGAAFGPLGVVLGRAAGALAGNLIDQSLFGSNQSVKAPVLDGGRISSPDEGSAITRVYGTMRVAGDLIWATRFKEKVITERQGGKSSSQSVETRNYFANFAVAICEGEISSIRRVWADGRRLDINDIDVRIYYGTQDQEPDPLIVAKQGAEQTPAYRGIAYAVFDRLPIDTFGNRIPLIQFEVTRVISELENKIEAVTLIPGATEHGLATKRIREVPKPGEGRFLNANMNRAETDIHASLDDLQRLCPNLKNIGLVVSWFGSDLRADQCIFQPGVEVENRRKETRAWQVGSRTRNNAYLISQQDGAPVYGGTPDDKSVIEAIQEIKSRGLNVTLYPFVLMDIPEDNTLSSPDGAATQPPFPWRGRITCDPAIGQAGTADQTSLADSQISDFMGSAQKNDFNISGQSVGWSGVDYRYRHMILHYAHIAKIAANAGAPVDAFVIGSEMVNLSRVRNDLDEFPFVQALMDLADDVQSVLGNSTKLTYAADWSEYFGYHPQDGSGDVFYHLDDLWSHAAISAIGIDNYMPLSDWRDEDLENANPDGFAIANDMTALENQISSGEGFDYYYESENNRADRIRTPITDGAGKPWVYRFKDLRSWWENTHYNRANGVEVTTPTSWVSGSKPIWFTEFGCPAVDKGANQPNVFPDPKSSENAYPYFSSQTRDDQAQRAFLTAHINHWNSAENSPQMVDPENSYVWTWDARPYPTFPERTDLWSDGHNWRTGHWINGRLGNAPLGELIGAILTDHGFDNYDVSGVEGTITGYLQSDVYSARALIEPLLSSFQIDVSEVEDRLVFTSRMRVSKSTIDLSAIVDDKDDALISYVRTQEGELANEVHFDHLSIENDYAAATAYSKRLSRDSLRQQHIALPVALDSETAHGVANLWLQDHWASRENIEFSLPINNTEIEPGDRISFSASDELGDFYGTYSIVSIEDNISRKVKAKRHVAAAIKSNVSDQTDPDSSDESSDFSPDMVLVDLPILSGKDEMNWARGAAYVKPWTHITLSSSAGEDGFVARQYLTAPSRLGYLIADFETGYEGRFDYQNQLLIDLSFGEFESVSKDQLLAGSNIIAVQSRNGAYEIVQFLNAEEVATGQWQLSGLLRAQAGTDDAMLAGADIGAYALVIDEAVTSLGLTASELGTALNWQITQTGKSTSDLDKISFAGGARANTPISPVHVKAQRKTDGVLLSWIRRSRYNADLWTGLEVPLDEDELLFELDIYSGNQVVRNLQLGESEYFYPTNEELADFGAAQNEITFAVRQLGGQITSGIERKATLVL